MRRPTIDYWISKEDTSPLLRNYSDPSEEYDSFNQGLISDRITQATSLKYSKNNCYKKTNFCKNLNSTTKTIVYGDERKEFNSHLENSEEAFWNQHTNQCVTSKSGKNSKKTNGCKTKNIVPRILKSLSFLAALSSINSFSLALGNFPMESRTTHSAPLTVSLLESNDNNHLSPFGNNTSLVEMKQKAPTKPYNRLTSFLQKTLQLSQNEKRKRTGGNRRSGKSKKGKDQETEKKTKWTDYMEKFDIAKVHGSGVYVDLGGSATVGGYEYRMPTGKCPVVGKAVILENGADFLNSITHHDPKKRGLAFPPTKVSSNSSKVDMENQLLSPASAQLLRSWNYKHESDLSNCAEYSKNIIPGSNRDSKYRYPFVYDETDKLCYILYSPMQYNQGVKYCDTDSADEGTSSLACMYPDKDKEDARLFYGTSSLHMDWNVVCPVYPIKDAIFGTYDDEKDECTPLDPIYVEDADDYGECSKILFEYSPSDVDVSSNNQKLSDVDRYKEAMNSGHLSTALSIMFAPRYSEDRPIYTKGVGINWATYDKNEKKCNILDSIPSCLVISNGFLSLTSLSSPNEKDAVPYPCDIVHGKGFLKNPNSKKKKEEGEEEEKEDKEEGEEKKEEKEEKKEKKEEKKNLNPLAGMLDFVPYTSLKKEGFECEKFVHTINNASCGSYLECSAYPLAIMSRWKKSYTVLIIVSIVLLAILGYLGYRFYQNRSFKRYESKLYDDNDFYDSDFEVDAFEGEQNSRNRDDYNVHGDEQIWSRHEPRNSDVTPVRISRVERHN